MFRLFAALIVSLLSLSVAQAQEATPWRTVVDQQIEALQGGEAETALGLASAAFREMYSDPERFLADVARSGYAPIIASRSHSFGTFETAKDGTVLQVVKLIGPDQSLYEAVYQMMDEPDAGWRVQGVVLRKVPGMGV